VRGVFASLFVSAKNFAPGAPIGGTTLFLGGRLEGRLFVPLAHEQESEGHFQSNVPGYVGFQTNNGDLGWIKIEVLDRRGEDYPDGVEAIDWAYNNVPGAGINAGQTPSPSVPEPDSRALALLGMGAAGLLTWRRRRDAVRPK
jgi:MYXO-CTERM domain-containing protein